MTSAPKPGWPLAARKVRTTAIAGKAVLALLGLLGLVGSVLAPASAVAAPGDQISIVNGTTAPVFSYTNAIRERVYIPVPGVDEDDDGLDDITVIDIIRPAESNGTLRVPAIIDPSPYYTTLGRGNEGERIADLDGDGINDVWPTFYDNYFVPRGYAVILAHMNGTGLSTGCPTFGGAGDIESMKVVIDWLQGRAAGYDAANNPVFATWTNGKAAMIGKSYDGTLANGVAATGVPGLTTIVPISAISDWYKYLRTNGIRRGSPHGPATLALIVGAPARLDQCQSSRDAMSLADGDDSGDINDFWTARNYLTDVDNVTASVFAVSGLNDDNVEMDQLAPYWEALAQRHIPRKLWLAKIGHVDPFDYRRDVWVDTLHRWFDYWLQGVDNGIMNEPTVTVETDPGDFENYTSWPIPGTQNVNVYLRSGQVGTPGALLLQPSGTATDSAFTGAAGDVSEDTLMATPDTVSTGRLVFLSEPLQTDLRISGTPIIQLNAALDQVHSNLTAILVDYGQSTRTTRDSEGIHTLTTSSCWGESSANDDACYFDVARTSTTTDVWRVSNGVLDSRNRDTLIEGLGTNVVPGQEYAFHWPLEPYDQTFSAGHRIGVVVSTNLSGYAVDSPAVATTVTVDTTASRIVLPIVGGLQAAAHAVGLGSAAPVTLHFDLRGHGAAVPDQSVAYGTAPATPSAPTESGWVFQGWFTDTTLSTAFDFTAAMSADATAYASWAPIATVVKTLKIVASSTNASQGETITVSVEGFDSTGGSLGDVTQFATLDSSVLSDIIVGNSITFVHASPHVITATLGTVSANVTVHVSPTGGPTALSSTGTDSALPLSLVAMLLVACGGLALLGRRFGAGRGR